MTNNSEFFQPEPSEKTFEPELPTPAELAKTVYLKINQLALCETAMITALMDFTLHKSEVEGIKEQLKNTENGIILGYAENEKVFGANETIRKAKLEELTKETREKLLNLSKRTASKESTLEQTKIKFSSIKKQLEAYKLVGELLGRG